MTLRPSVGTHVDVVGGVDDVHLVKSGHLTQHGEVTATAVVVDQRRVFTGTAASTTSAASDIQQSIVISTSPPLH